MVRFIETISLESQEMERLKENSLEVINGLKIVTALPSLLSGMFIPLPAAIYYNPAGRACSGQSRRPIVESG